VTTADNHMCVVVTSLHHNLPTNKTDNKLHNLHYSIVNKQSLYWITAHLLICQNGA